MQQKNQGESLDVNTLTHPPSPSSYTSVVVSTPPRFSLQQPHTLSSIAEKMTVLGHIGSMTEKHTPHDSVLESETKEQEKEIVPSSEQIQQQGLPSSLPVAKPNSNQVSALCDNQSMQPKEFTSPSPSLPVNAASPACSVEESTPHFVTDNRKNIEQSNLENVEESEFLSDTNFPGLHSTIRSRKTRLPGGFLSQPAMTQEQVNLPNNKKTKLANTQSMVNAIPHTSLTEGFSTTSDNDQEMQTDAA